MIGSVLRRVLRGSEREAELERCQRQLHATQTRLEKLKADHAHASQRLAAIGAQLDLARARTARWKHEAARHRRRVLSPSVTQDLLGTRLAQLPVRASAREASSREARLLAVSAPYREMIERGGEVDESVAKRIQLDGLVWWVPTLTTDQSFVRRVVDKETLPYRAITQTREFSVGGVMLDLGAHDGSTAIPRVVLGDVEACYCAEPDPVNYACLAANVKANGLRGFVLPDRVAIGRADGTGHLLRTKATRGHHLVAPAEAGAETIEVPIRTLDGWIAALGVDPRAISFIKSDTQGYELQLLQGAPRLLAHDQIAWQLEVCPHLMENAGSDPRDFVAFVQRHFTHYVDLNMHAPGRRRKPIDAVGGVLEYLVRDGRTHTDIVVYRASAVERG